MGEVEGQLCSRSVFEAYDIRFDQVPEARGPCDVPDVARASLRSQLDQFLRGLSKSQGSCPVGCICEITRESGNEPPWLEDMPIVLVTEGRQASPKSEGAVYRCSAKIHHREYRGVCKRVGS